MRVDDLNNHKLLHYSNHVSGAVWKITSNTGELRQIRTGGALSVNDGQSLLHAAVSGLGIAYLPSFLYSGAMKAGQVVDVMPHLPQEKQGIYLIYPRVALPNPKCAPSLIFLWVPFPAKGQMSGDDLSNILNAGIKSSAL